MGTPAVLPGESIQDAIENQSYSMPINYGDLPQSVTDQMMLPQLPDLGAPSMPNVTEAPATNNGVTFENPMLNSLASGINNAVSTAKGLATGGTVLQWIEDHVEDLVFIILGLLLIAAGVFSFKTSQTIIREGGRAAASAAAAA